MTRVKIHRDIEYLYTYVRKGDLVFKTMKIYIYYRIFIYFYLENVNIAREFAGGIKLKILI